MQPRCGACMQLTGSMNRRERNQALQANKLGAMWAVLDRAISGALEDYSPSSAAILLWLSYWPPMSVSELGKVLSLSQPACSRAIDRLAASGFVRKSHSGSRETLVEILAAGRIEAMRLQTQRLSTLSAMLSTLAKSEQAEFTNLLNKLLAGAVENRADARHICRFCDHGVCDGPFCPVGCRATQIEQSAQGDDRG
ncbi:Transcriptional regulator, MarR family [Thiomonas delicata]|uniref:Transcriptional regulator, MarR family n=3 Tax=Thiomonas TaxID=32012 RepID=A0A238D2H5_THIDL|nr:Transcriptional regulator, MarR family [Thiomonas delicata]